MPKSLLEIIKELGFVIVYDGKGEEKICPNMSETQIYILLSGKLFGVGNKDYHLINVANYDKDNIMLVVYDMETTNKCVSKPWIWIPKAL